MKNGCHTTGIYSTNADREALPPLYILDSKARYPEIFKIDARVAEGLPQVVGHYGNLCAAKYDSCLAVHKKGGMDLTLWEKVAEELLLPLYPNTSQTVERCHLTSKILRGPLIVKTGVGPGRLCKEAHSWEFRDRMWRAGVFIILGLPNGTVVNQKIGPRLCLLSARRSQIYSTSGVDVAYCPCPGQENYVRKRQEEEDGGGGQPGRQASAA